MWNAELPLGVRLRTCYETPVLPAVLAPNPPQEKPKEASSRRSKRKHDPAIDSAEGLAEYHSGSSCY